MQMKKGNAGQPNTSPTGISGNNSGHMPADVSASSQIYFDPAKTTVGKNQNFTLDAKINPDKNQVTAVELHITFDPAKVHLTDAAAPKEIWGELQSAKIDNTKGTASIIVGIVPKSPPTLVTETTTIATFTFEAIGSGAAEIDFADSTKAAAKGINTNVVTKMTGAQVAIQ